LGRATDKKRAEANVIGVTEPGFCAGAFCMIHEVQIIGDNANIRKDEIQVRIVC
jgi:hypothetical protein